MKTEFYDCRTTSQKYFGSLRLIDFVSQAFSKNRVLQQNRYWTTCTSTYMIRLKSSMRNKMAIWTDWCCCQDKVPQSKPVHTTIQFPDACSSLQQVTTTTRVEESLNHLTGHYWYFLTIYFHSVNFENKRNVNNSLMMNKFFHKLKKITLQLLVEILVSKPYCNHQLQKGQLKVTSTTGCKNGNQW